MKLDISTNTKETVNIEFPFYIKYGYSNIKNNGCGNAEYTYYRIDSDRSFLRIKTKSIFVGIIGFSFEYLYDSIATEYTLRRYYEENYKNQKLLSEEFEYIENECLEFHKNFKL